MISNLQKIRIEFHLGLLGPLDPVNFRAVQRDFVLTGLDPDIELSLVGDPLSTDMVVFEGQNLASKSSLLGRAELAFSVLGPQTIDASLYVSKAGSVELRGNELKNRKDLYREIVKQLAYLLGVGPDNSDSGRVGYAD